MQYSNILLQFHNLVTFHTDVVSKMVSGYTLSHKPLKRGSAITSGESIPSDPWFGAILLAVLGDGIVLTACLCGPKFWQAAWSAVCAHTHKHTHTCCSAQFSVTVLSAPTSSALFCCGNGQIIIYLEKEADDHMSPWSLVTWSRNRTHKPH